MGRIWVLLLLAAVVSCTGDPRPGSPTGHAVDPECVDRDDDEHGENCEAGPDCNDHDPDVFEGCLRCATPELGCPCAEGTQPRSCFLEPSTGDDGATMCHEGTRYCREGLWSDCEDVHTYPLPESRKRELAALVDEDAGPVQCNDCDVTCFRITDSLLPQDGGLTDANSDDIDWVEGGGLTLSRSPADAGGGGGADSGADAAACMPGVAPDIDCDGIPDEWDPYPDDPPFATANPTIFLDIAPGETGVGEIDISFLLNSVDLYLLVDQSASMSDERDNLVENITGDAVSGNPAVDLISCTLLQRCCNKLSGTSKTTCEAVVDADDAAACATSSALYCAGNEHLMDCADADFDHVPDNEVKSQGLVGAVRCLIRDTRFGVGFHREIPFSGYAPSDQLAFGHYQDITSDLTDVFNAADRLHTIGNYDWPEASMVALYSLVTGEGMYFGTTKPGVPPRLDCPSGTWGYPCFREDAIPIVILFTDAMMHNGPTANHYAYSSSLGIRAGTDEGTTESAYHPIDGNETFASAYAAGDVTDSLYTFIGDSSTMSDDIPSDLFSCLSTDGSPDAVVSFSLSQQREVLLRTEGSHFDTTLGLFTGVPSDPQELEDSDNQNEDAARAASLGPISGSSVTISGDTSVMDADYDWSAIQCSGASASPDAVYSFSLDSDTRVSISTEGSTLDTVVGLYSGAPGLAPSYTASGDGNDDLDSATAMGEAYNSTLAYSGDSDNVSATFLGSEVGCGADDAAPDAVYSFQLLQPTTVRVSTEGSSFDTVVALVGDNCAAEPPAQPENESSGNSAAVSGADYTFAPGSLIIPMDTSYQNTGMVQAYGLVNDLLLSDIPVSWVIKKNKANGDSDFTASAVDHVSTALVTDHAYRGGPFVIDASDAADATAVIDAWQSSFPSVTVHESTSELTGFVRKQLVAAPRIAVLNSGDTASLVSYLTAAGIPDSDGDSLWASSPDFLSVAGIAGGGGGSDGALFDSEGTPRFCQLVTKDWTTSGSGTSNGQAAVTEIRSWLELANHVFAQGQSVFALENNTNGQLLTQTGYLVGDTVSSFASEQADLTFAQYDGSFATYGGSYPSFSLPAADDYLDNDVVMITDSDGDFGENNLWVTGRLDGECSILSDTCDSGQALGTVSYLGGAAHTTLTPITSNPGTNGTRLFLNSLFTADCSSDLGRPAPELVLFGPLSTQNTQETYDITYSNDGAGIAYDTTLQYEIPSGATLVAASAGYSQSGSTLSWNLGSLDVAESGTVSITIEFTAGFGSYANQAVLSYEQGVTPRQVSSWTLSTNYSLLPDGACTSLGVDQQTADQTIEDQDTALQLADLSGRIFAVTGNSSGMDADFEGSDLGCGAADGSPDAVVEFTLSEDSDVTIDTDGSDFDTVLGLYNGSIATDDSVDASNDNETTSDFDSLGGVDGKRIVVSGNTTGMTADYDADEAGCSVSGSDSSPDAVYRFTVTTGTTVRLDTYGSSFDTTLSLHDDPIVPAGIGTTIDYTLPSDNNDDQGSAFVGLANVDGAVQTYRGDSSDLDSDYTVCGRSDSEDAVFRFHVDTAGTYTFDTRGSDFDTVLGLFPDVIGQDDSPLEYAGHDNDRRNKALDVGTINGTAVSYYGNTEWTGDDWNQSGCGGDDDAYDAFFEFTLTEETEVKIDTDGSYFDTILMLYRYTNGSSYDFVECDDRDGPGSTSEIVRTLQAGTYFVVVTGDDEWDDGWYYLSIEDTSRVGYNQIICDDDISYYNRDSEFSVYLVPGDYHAVVKGYSSSSEGDYVLNVTDPSPGGAGEPNLVECDDNSSSTQQSEIERYLDPGTYYAVVKGTSSGANGNYTLTLQDVDNPPSSGFLECDSGSGPDGSSQIQASLTAGTYWVALKGTGSSEHGDYVLNLSDDEAAIATVIECDDDSGDGSTSVIERELAPGTYYVVVKGDTAADGGDYNLSVRDVDNQGFNLIACDQDSGPGQTSYIERDLTAGDYYLMVKGDAASDAAPYTLTVHDTANSSLGAIACDDDSGSYRTSEIVRTLNPGTYYAVVKGYDETQSGQYQLTVGGADTVSTNYVPPTWSQTRQALVDNEVRVMSVLSCHDDWSHGSPGDCDDTRDQAEALANESDALGANDNELVFDIDSDGDGLSRTVVEGIASLADYLQMDVRVAVAFDPDANPGFNVTINAVDETGDGCGGLSGTEHTDCIPGATPKFQIMFENPLPGVPSNDDDPNGGYNFRAQLIGNDRFIIDEVPIYIIPDDVIPMGPEEPPYEASGTYWQDVASPGCATGSNERPDWRDLSWSGDVPENTTVTFAACTAEAQEDLDGCVPTVIAQVTGTGPCDSDADCSIGYCDTDINTCQVASAGNCSSDSECGSNSFCDIGGTDACVYESLPVYIGGALGSQNLQRYLRMAISMTAEPPYDVAPTLYDWEITYLCNNVL